MTCTRPSRSIPTDPYAGAYERRVRAIWMDYLETTRTASKGTYDEVERNAWQRLQRRLDRNEARSREYA